jgi:hypothetical protein
MCVVAAVAASVVVAAMKLAGASDLDHGLPSAVSAVARVAFVPFWLSYTGGAWVALGFRRFVVVRDHARELGLAFAAAIAIHICLILWQTLRGDPPALMTAVIFGVAALLTLILTVISFRSFADRLPRVALARFRAYATTYVALVYLLDFAHRPQPDGLHYWVAYGSFAALDVVGLTVRVLAWLREVSKTWRRAPAR